jgi:DNA-binding XRE family transcriptional regulator
MEADLASTLRLLRERSGLTQAQMGQAIGLTRTAVVKIESGKATTSERLRLWASACHARLVLVREGEDLGMLEEGERRLIEGYRGLEDWRRAVVEQILVALPAMGPQAVAMLAVQLDAAARLASSSSGGGDAGEPDPRHGARTG